MKKRTAIMATLIVMIITAVVLTLTLIESDKTVIKNTELPEQIKKQIITEQIKPSENKQIATDSQVYEQDNNTETENKITDVDKNDTFVVQTQDLIENETVKDDTESSSNKNKEIIDEIVQPPDYSFFDWNEDGVEDYLRQDIDGKYYVFPNYGTNENPIFKESYLYENETNN